MRCRGCNAQLTGRVLNDHTGEPDDLCYRCRSDAFEAADSSNYEELVPGNYVWPAKRNPPDAD
jgi:hypothetical protein